MFPANNLVCRMCVDRTLFYKEQKGEQSYQRSLFQEVLEEQAQTLNIVNNHFPLFGTQIFLSVPFAQKSRALIVPLLDSISKNLWLLLNIFKSGLIIKADADLSVRLADGNYLKKSTRPMVSLVPPEMKISGQCLALATDVHCENTTLQPVYLTQVQLSHIIDSQMRADQK